MFAGHNPTVLEVLRTSGLLDEQPIAELEAISTEPGACVSEAALSRGMIGRSELLAATAAFLGCDLLESPPVAVASEVAGLLPARIARRYGAVPVAVDDEHLKVVTLNPFHPDLEDDLRFAAGREVQVLVCDPALVTPLLEATYGGGDGESFGEIFTDFPESGNGETDRLLVGEDSAQTAGDPPVVRFVQEILSRAVRDGASDVHFEPYESTFRVRYRVDGTLHDLSPPDPALAMAVVSRIKVLADLNIAERRVPQDGRLRMAVAEREVDLRVSTLPTQFGESLVLRVLDKSVLNLDLDELGIPQDVRDGIRRVARRPHGVFIVTGPTGSGKTTTLYSALREVNDEERKILTAEDPVEYEVEGLIQTTINPAIGLTFAKALRAFLRQDPDKILVGEIRDGETAQIAAQAALTGHLVFTTLHTNDAAGAVTRLVDLGLERYLIASSLEGVLAQRLLRRVCPECREPCEPAPETLDALGLSTERGEARFARGSGCARCHETGYSGRLGLFEMIEVDDAFRELITAGASARELYAAAEARGTRSLRSEGCAAVLRGETTAEEVLKYT